MSLFTRSGTLTYRFAARTSSQMVVHAPRYDDRWAHEAVMSHPSHRFTPSFMSTYRPFIQSSSMHRVSNMSADPTNGACMENLSRITQDRSVIATGPSAAITHSSPTNITSLPRSPFTELSPVGDWHLQKVYRGHTSSTTCVGGSSPLGLQTAQS